MKKSLLQSARQEAYDVSLPPSTPLWVKVFGASFILLILMFLAMMVSNISAQMMASGMRNMSGQMMAGMNNMGSGTSRNLPLWIELVGLVALVVVLGFFIAMLAGIGGRGSGRIVSETRKATTLLLSPWARKLTLTTHIISSVGWIGAVVTFLGLAVIQLTSQVQPSTQRVISLKRSSRNSQTMVFSPPS